MNKRKAEDQSGKERKLIRNAAAPSPREEAQPQLKKQKIAESNSRNATRDIVRYNSTDIRKKQKESTGGEVDEMQFIFAHWLLYELWVAGVSDQFVDRLERFFSAALNTLGFIKAIAVYMISRNLKRENNSQNGYATELKAIVGMLRELEATGFARAVTDASDMKYQFEKKDERKRLAGEELRQELKDTRLDLFVWGTMNATVAYMPALDDRIELLCKKCVGQLWKSCTANPGLPLAWCWSVMGHHPEIEALHGILSNIDVSRDGADPQNYGSAWRQSTLGAARTLHLALEIINWDFELGDWKTSLANPLLFLDPKRTIVRPPVVFVGAGAGDVDRWLQEKELIEAKHPRLGRLKLLQAILVQVIANCADWFDKFWAKEKSNAVADMTPVVLSQLLLPKISMAQLATQIDHLEDTFSPFFLDLVMDRPDQTTGKDPGARFKEAKKELKAFRASLLERAFSLLEPPQEKKKTDSSSSGQKGTVEIDWSGNYTERFIVGVQYADWKTWCASIKPAETGAYRYNDRVFYCSRTKVARLPFHLYEDGQKMSLSAEAKTFATLRDPEQLYRLNTGGVAMLWSTSRKGIAGEQHLMTFYLPPAFGANSVGVHMTPTSLQVLLVLQYVSMGNAGGLPHTRTAYDTNPQLAQLEMWEAIKNGTGGPFDLRVVDYLQCQETTMGVLRVRPLVVLQPTDKLKTWATDLLAQNKGSPEQEAKLDTEAFAVASALMNTDDPWMPDMTPELMPLFRGMAAVVHQLAEAKLDRYEMDKRAAFIRNSWNKEQRAKEQPNIFEILRQEGKNTREIVGEVTAMETAVEEKFDAVRLVLESPAAKLAEEVDRLKKKLAALNATSVQMKGELEAQDAAATASEAKRKANPDSKEAAEQVKRDRENAKNLARAAQAVTAEYDAMNARFKEATSALKRQQVEDELDNAGEDRMADYRELGLVYIKARTGANINEEMMDTGGDTEEKKSAARLRFTSLTDEDIANFRDTRYQTHDPTLRLSDETQQLWMLEEKSRNVAALSQVTTAIEQVARFFGETNTLYCEAKAAEYGTVMEAMGTAGGHASMALLQFENLATRLTDLTVLCESNFRQEAKGLFVFEEIIPTERTVNDLLDRLPQLSGDAFRQLATATVVGVDPTVEGLGTFGEYLDKLEEEKKKKKSGKDEKMSDDKAPAKRKKTKRSEADKPMESPPTWANLSNGLKLHIQERTDQLKKLLAYEEEKSLEHKTWSDRLVAFLLTVYGGKDADAVATALHTLCATSSAAADKASNEGVFKLGVTVLWLYALHVGTARRAANAHVAGGLGFTRLATERRRIILQHIALADRTLRLNYRFLQQAVNSSPVLRGFFSMHTDLLFSLDSQVCPLETTWPDGDGNEQDARLRKALERYALYGGLTEQEKTVFVEMVLTGDLQLARWDGNDLTSRIRKNRLEFEAAYSEWDETRMDEPPEDLHVVALYGSYAPIDGLDRPSFVATIADSAQVRNITKLPGAIRSSSVPDWSVNDLHFFEYNALDYAFWAPPMVTLRDLDDIIWRQLSLYGAVNYSVDPSQTLLPVYEIELDLTPKELHVNYVDIKYKTIREACANTKPLTDFIEDLLQRRAQFRDRLYQARAGISRDALSEYMHDVDVQVRLAVMGEIPAIATIAGSTAFQAQIGELATKLTEACMQIVDKEEKQKKLQPHRIALALPAERAPVFSPRAPGYCALYWPDQLLAAVRDWLLRLISEEAIGQFGDPDKFDADENYAFLKSVGLLPRDIIKQSVLFFYRTRAESLRNSYFQLFSRVVQRSTTKRGDLVLHTRYFQHLVASAGLHGQLVMGGKGKVEAPVVLEKLTNPLLVRLFTMRKKARDREPDKEAKEIEREVARELRADGKSSSSSQVLVVMDTATTEEPKKKKNKKIDEDDMMQGRYEAELSAALANTLVIRE